MKTGIEFITDERQEQLTKHVRSTEQDIRLNPNGELKMVARYLLGYGVSSEYPRTWNQNYKYSVDSKTEVQKLIIAGALLAAEIDRINALENVRTLIDADLQEGKK